MKALKFIALIAACSLALALVSCGDSEPSATGSNLETTAEDTTAEDTTAEDTTAAE